jgi:hypothetical protein
MNNNQSRATFLFPDPCSLLPVPYSLFPFLYPPPPYKYFFGDDFLADDYESREENDAKKVKNPRVIIEQNSVSGKIVNVRENAHEIPRCRKWLAGNERFSPKKEAFLLEK